MRLIGGAALLAAFVATTGVGTGALTNAQPGAQQNQHTEQLGQPITSSPGDQAGIAGSAGGNGITGAAAPRPMDYGPSTFPRDDLGPLGGPGSQAPYTGQGTVQKPVAGGTIGQNSLPGEGVEVGPNGVTASPQPSDRAGRIPGTDGEIQTSMGTRQKTTPGVGAQPFPMPGKLAN